VSRAKAEKKRASRPSRLGELRRRVPTPDDWAPTIVTETGERVVDGMVFFDDYPNAELRYFVRVCFWGGDDLGRDHDFATNDVVKAGREFRKWREWLENLTSITLAELKALGFVVG